MNKEMLGLQNDIVRKFSEILRLELDTCLGDKAKFVIDLALVFTLESEAKLFEEVEVVRDITVYLRPKDSGAIWLLSVINQAVQMLNKAVNFKTMPQGTLLRPDRIEVTYERNKELEVTLYRKWFKMRSISEQPLLE